MSELSEKQEKMLTQPVEKLVVRLAIPSIVIMLISSVYNLADTYFVSGLGKSATAAIGVIFSFMAIIQAIGFFFGHGSGNYISRRIGANEFDKAEIMASTGFFLSIIVGLLLTVSGLIFMNPLLKALGSSETMFSYAKDYLLWILLAAPFMCASLTLNNQLRYLASANSAMWGMVSGAVLNIGLDPILIYVFHLGTFGAGLSTAISQFVSFCILFAMTLRAGNLRMKFKNFKPSFANVKEIFRGGSPSLLRQGFNAVSILVFNHTAGLFGDAAVAAISVVQRVTQFAVSALLGFGQGFQPVCGFNYGAKKYDRVIKAFMFCTKLITTCLVVLAILGAIFAPQIVSLFASDDPCQCNPCECAPCECNEPPDNALLLEIGTKTLRLQCISIPLMGFVILCNMLLQTIGAAGKANLIAICRSGVFLIPSILLLVHFFDIPGLEASQLVADVLTFALVLPLSIGTLAAMRRASKDPTVHMPDR